MSVFLLWLLRTAVGVLVLVCVALSLMGLVWMGVGFGHEDCRLGLVPGSVGYNATPAYPPRAPEGYGSGR